MRRNFYFIIIAFLITFAVICCFFVFRKDKINQRYSLENSSKKTFSLPALQASIVRKSNLQKAKKGYTQKIIRPSIIKAVYLTSWAAGRKDYVDYVISLAKDTEINAVVIDIKDYSGYVGYITDVEEVKKYNAQEGRIRDVKSLIKKLHKNGIYTIARIVVFQDPVLARARPDLAVASKTKISGLKKLNSLFSSTAWSVDTLWTDKKGLSWVDPASLEVWDYNIAIAKDAALEGFDEINFDYVRFPSDGDLGDMIFPVWNTSTSKREVIKHFFGYLHKELQNQVISVDLFGLSCTREDDLGIGQRIEDTFGYFDYVCPMVYPSHYENGFLGYQEPAKYPYEVVKYSLERALVRLKQYKRPEEKDTKIRPWIQDFSLGGVPYGIQEVKKEIQAVHDSLGDDFFGFMLWSPSNVYTKEALQKRDNSFNLFWF